MNKRTFTKFSRHSNNIKETIDADDINKIQGSVNKAELNILTEQSNRFNDDALFAFDNNLFANAIAIDTYSDMSMIDYDFSKNIDVDVSKGSVTLKETGIEGVVATTVFHSTLGDFLELNDFFIITKEYVPVGAKILHYIENHNGEVFEIKRNDSSPLNFKTGFNGVRVYSKLVPNSNGESPSLNGLAVMFFDISVESQYGLSNPDISRFEQSSIGTTVLVRDKALDDKLVKVIEPSCVTDLRYSGEEKRLDSVESVFTNEAVSIKDVLNYGDYENSLGETDNVLLSITTIQNKVVEGEK